MTTRHVGDQDDLAAEAVEVAEGTSRRAALG